jgi:eukaryotic-like serine/threonine-protein kinase
MDVTDVEPLSAVACPECGAPAVITATIDHFELVDVIGHGGMGAVYKAHDTSLDRAVALKLLRKSSGTPEQIAQLETEAAITASINHPHVVRVFSTGMDHGRFYIAMELVEKGTLDNLIELQGHVAEAQVLEVGIQIASGLRAAQYAGLIHRDVKPGNILFADSHTAKIVDFGLAIFEEDEAKVRGEIWGTPYYVAPEKLDHKPEDFRSDIYSLGGTLFHALAGRPPFEAQNASLVALKHLKSQAVSLQAFAPHVSSQTAYVINRTLSKDPDQRYQSYDELIEHLEYARTELQTSGGKPKGVKRVVMETEEDKRAMGWVVMGLLAMVIVLGILGFVFRDRFTPGKDTSASDTAKFNPALFTPAFKSLAEDKPAEAIEALNKVIAQNPGQPQANWANTFLGLAQFMSGKRADAMATYEKIDALGPFSKKESDKALATFFLETARSMSRGVSVDPKSVTVTNDVNYGTLVWLLYGVKNWDLGSHEQGAELLRKFRQVTPAGKDVWIAELKPVATMYVDQFTAYEVGMERAKAAKTIDEKKAAAAALAAVQGKLGKRAQEQAAKVNAEAAKMEKERAAMWATGKIPDGRYRLTNRQSKKVIEVEGRSKDDGKKVQIVNYTNQPNQHWNITALGNGYYLIVGGDSGKALTVPKGAKDELLGLVQGNVKKDATQKWKIEKEGEYWKLTSEASGKAVTQVGSQTTGGNTIVQSDYTGAFEQQWKIE